MDDSDTFARIAVRLEGSRCRAFRDHDFSRLISEAITVILGSAGPTFKIGHFDPSTLKGSVIVQREDVNRVWAALSFFGTYSQSPIAIHLSSVAHRDCLDTMVSLAVFITVGVVLAGVALIVVFALYFSIPSRRDLVLRGKHALVTGGSKGIGKQLSLSLLARGANVTIVARNESDLKGAAEELQMYADQRGQRQKVQWRSADLAGSYGVIESMVRDAEKEFGPVDVLINNAGHSVQDAFDKLPVGSFESQMKINYLSAVHMTRAVVVSMKERRAGHISFVSSAAGQCAIYGYTAYSAAKFALRGFADALHMELLPYKVSIGVLYPPNTDTEGFKVELDTMPEEVRLISETAGLFSPKDVAEAHIRNIERGEYSTTIGLDGWMLGTLTAGAAPEPNLFKAVVQSALAGVLRAVMLLYIGYFNGIVKKCYRKRLPS